MFIVIHVYYQKFLSYAKLTMLLAAASVVSVLIFSKSWAPSTNPLRLC